jgi:hypothetical protein
MEMEAALVPKQGNWPVHSGLGVARCAGEGPARAVGRVQHRWRFGRVEECWLAVHPFGLHRQLLPLADGRSATQRSAWPE